MSTGISVLSQSLEVDAIRVVQSCSCSAPKLYVKYKGRNHYVPLRLCNNKNATADGGQFVDLVHNQVINGIKSFTDAVYLDTSRVKGGSTQVFGNTNAGGLHNIAIGNGAGNHLTGQKNLAIGDDSLANGASVNSNTAVGIEALEDLDSGDSNAALGYKAGSLLTSGSGNVFLGQGSGVSGSYSNRLYIANISTPGGSESDHILVGDFSSGIVKLPKGYQNNDTGKVLTTGADGTLSLIAVSAIAIDTNIANTDLTVPDNITRALTIGTSSSLNIAGGNQIKLDSTVVAIDASNTVTTFNPPSKQLKVGSLADFPENLSFIKSATIQITQNHNSNGNNATYIGMTSPSANQPNGWAMLGYGTGARLVPYTRTLSNQSIPTLTAPTWDVGYGHHVMMYENATNANMGFVIGVQRAINTSAIDFTAAASLLKDTTHLFNVQETNGMDANIISSSNWRFWICKNGDLHTSGTIYTPSGIISANTTLALTVHKYIHTGAAITLTLPDPAIADNKHREHIILNHGTGNITFSYPVTIANGATITDLGSGNGITIICDGTVWRGFYHARVSIAPTLQSVSDTGATTTNPLTINRGTLAGGTDNLTIAQNDGFIAFGNGTGSAAAYVPRILAVPVSNFNYGLQVIAQGNNAGYASGALGVSARNAAGTGAVSAGKLLSLLNYTTEKFSVDHAGNTVMASDLTLFSAINFATTGNPNIRSSGIVSFLNGNAAQGIKVGNLVISNSYSNNAPTNGLYVTGNIQAASQAGTGNRYVTVDAAGVQSATLPTPLSGSYSVPATARAANSATSLGTVTITGAAVGRPVHIAQQNNGLIYKAVVTAANAVTIWVHNNTTAAITPAAETLSIIIF